ncbi:hypothetical protein M427DRAFT_353992 [Gonapodya prolifera JEL478]|uniref:Uncharacterized protein n=1 Tax=Gonapodya prolifera (strain JEL478) TaxID=1344416 RepID=A0A139AC68_GONPJ|nr:hypothetical protein M427DRAFT_353992 [Gonapodya prolifera JEL478]|eukprot:KXS14357.1 hypothetical protein M427DRAFT_353992 [Gonapodya prolifera JEL478]
MATELSLQNPLLTIHQLETTPSRRDGLSENLETDLRLFGSELVQSVGILLQLPQTSIAIALVLFQRFFFVSSFRQYGLRVGRGPRRCFPRLQSRRAATQNRRHPVRLRLLREAAPPQVHRPARVLQRGVLRAPYRVPYGRNAHS